jgi:hypothetical protein
MKQKLYFVIAILFLFLAFFILIRSINLYQIESEDPLFILNINNLIPKQLILPVSYINEAPDGNFSGNWKNACEEASMTMVENYYLGNKYVSIKQAMDAMQKLFDYQDEIYGSNADSDAQRTMEIINNNLNYTATIIENPTVQQIKKEIQKKRPVITLHYGFELHNPNIPFAVYGSYYHQMVVIGYDDIKKEFIVHDDGDQKYGANHRYGYDLFMNSLHDFDYVTRKTNLPARVIFTSKK